MAKTSDSKRGGKPSKEKKKAKTLAQKADRHVLYQDSVQCVEAEIDFVDDTFKKIRGRNAITLREDFCGTANTSCEWVRRREGNSAIGVDLDAEVLEWGAKNNIADLGDAAHQITLYEQNVLDVRHEPVDTVLAMNFSYWILNERASLRRYFRQVRDAMVNDGIFFLDCYGGYEAQREMRERSENDGYTYVWDQAHFNPVNAHMRCYIHFHFPDGSKMNKAFTYDWRLWSLPEITELLKEAGFAKVSAWWQGWDENEQDGDGEYEPVEEADADAAWVCYIVAEK
ncbi:MAG: cyclopropane fatty-acyl-phospholipid synthase-like methyltransferase [Gammaproteobacteria bacterium]|jgi:cyclopropane fatty-acyl-phospholipid synthase-like methyltransferase